jgi:Protein of unknown function (DUF2750)
MITQKEIESILKQSKEIQFDYLIKRIADFEEIWLIIDDKGIVLLEADKNEFVLPIWPFKEFAILFCVEEYKECTPEVVSIYDFLEQELADLKANSYKLSIMPTQGKSSIVVAVDVFENALDAEMRKYE